MSVHRRRPEAPAANTRFNQRATATQMDILLGKPLQGELSSGPKHMHCVPSAGGTQRTKIAVRHVSHRACQGIKTRGATACLRPGSNKRWQTSLSHICSRRGGNSWKAFRHATNNGRPAAPPSPCRSSCTMDQKKS